MGRLFELGCVLLVATMVLFVFSMVGSALGLLTEGERLTCATASFICGLLSLFAMTLSEELERIKEKIERICSQRCTHSEDY